MNKIKLNIQMFADATPSSVTTVDINGKGALTTKISIVNQDIINNKTTIELKAQGSNNYGGYWLYGVGYYYSLDGGITWTTIYDNHSTTEIWKPTSYTKDGFVTTSFTFNHNDDGNVSLKLRVRHLFAYGASSSRWEGTGQAGYNATTVNYDITIPQIPRASLLTGDTDKNCTLGQSTTFLMNCSKYVNTYIDDFYVFADAMEYIRFRNGDITSYTKKIENISNGDFSYTLTAQELEDICDLHNTNQLITPIVALFTYSDSSRDLLIGVNSIGQHLTVSGLEPTFTSRTYNDTNSTSRSLTGNTTTTVSKFIRGLTNVNLSCIIDLKCNATIKEAKVNGINATITNNTITYSNVEPLNNKISIYIKDSRDYEITNEITFTDLNYINLSYNPSSRRNNPTENTIHILSNGNYFNGSLGLTSNSLSARFRVLNRDNTLFTDWQSIPSSSIHTYSDNTFSIDFLTDDDYDYNKSFILEVNIYDKVMSLTPSSIISSGIPVFYVTEKDMHLGKENGDSKFYLNGNEIGGININQIYPIGSIYMNIDGTANPNTLFPNTTWNKIEGQFLLGSGTYTDANNEQKTFVSGDNGGEYNHTLTVSELPSHTHSIGGISTRVSGNWNGVVASANANDTNWTGARATGNNTPHNNLPPYLVVNIWKRVA